MKSFGINEIRIKEIPLKIMSKINQILRRQVGKKIVKSKEMRVDKLRIEGNLHSACSGYPSASPISHGADNQDLSIVVFPARAAISSFIF